MNTSALWNNTLPCLGLASQITRLDILFYFTVILCSVPFNVMWYSFPNLWLLVSSAHRQIAATTTLSVSQFSFQQLHTCYACIMRPVSIATLIVFFSPGMIVIDALGRIACGTSTNGASHKIAGYMRVYKIICVWCTSQSKESIFVRQVLLDASVTP